MRGLLARLGLRLERDERLAAISAVWGVDRVDEALDFALEGGKLGLSVDELRPLVQAWHLLGMAGARPTPFEGFFSWAVRVGFMTEEERVEAFRAADAEDLLGMRDDEGPRP